MAMKFPGSKWLKDLENLLGTDERYSEIARKWEGDLHLIIQHNGNLTEQLNFYLDLWN